MSEYSERQLYKDKYKYFSSLGLDEVAEHLSELDARFDDVTRHYSGPLGGLRTRIRDEDMAELFEITEDVLPMSLNPAVQAEILDDSSADPAALTWCRIANFQMKIFTFMGQFDSSGVGVIDSGPGLSY